MSQHVSRCSSQTVSRQTFLPQGCGAPTARLRRPPPQHSQIRPWPQVRHSLWAGDWAGTPRGWGSGPHTAACGACKDRHGGQHGSLQGTCSAGRWVPLAGEGLHAPAHGTGALAGGRGRTPPWVGLGERGPPPPFAAPRPAAGGGAVCSASAVASLTTPRRLRARTPSPAAQGEPSVSCSAAVYSSTVFGLRQSTAGARV
mmetsp:Transcript_148313/g.259219  ORF Transcript_148313/g.259219 Transcript_148313/m.259219 type:complete len:200 (-) Transcript_148313:303-902(-)